MNSTPCTGVCKLHINSQICIGCGRARFELEAWDTYTEDELVYHTNLARKRLERMEMYMPHIVQRKPDEI